MKYGALVLWGLIGILFSGATWEERFTAFHQKYPLAPIYENGRDPNFLIDEKLLFAEVEKDLPHATVITVGTGSQKAYFLDYSTLLGGTTLEAIKLGISDIANYPCYMPKVLDTRILKPDETHSKTDEAINRRTGFFEVAILLGNVFQYYIDLERTLDDRERFGMFWLQNDELQSKVPTTKNYFFGHHGGWYVEKFGAEEGVYYVRYRNFLHLRKPVLESVFKKSVELSAEDVVRAVKGHCVKGI